MSSLVDDHWQIQRLLERYSWAIGAGDREGLVSLFVPEGTVELPAEGAVFGGVEGSVGELVLHWLHHAESPGRQLWSGAPLIEVDGDTATAQAFLAVPSIVLSALMEGSHFAFLGRTDDVFTRTLDGWRFARRVIEPWDAAAAVSPEAPEPGFDRTDDVDPLDGGGLTASVRLELEDHFADYAWAIDLANVEGAVATFDAHGRITDPDVEQEGVDGLRAFFSGLFVGFTDYTGRTHWIGPSRLHREGDTVSGRSFCLVLQRPRHGGSGGLQLVMEYDDRLVKTAGGWRFVERNIETWLGQDDELVERLPRYRRTDSLPLGRGDLGT